ncbi:putative pyruvate decarboxylase [Rosa chinensis]|uniref:pyruvate decarboxylase n=1 Tax=Rosa chinensis TaxID=74649 RepID=A0A2P6Q4J2_ROSCH|nr:putative pyruvate decarboxylase [Rosa chinensis]
MEPSTLIGATPRPTSALLPVVPAAACSGTLGRHLARRLVEIGVHDVFSVPGDFNLTLLDHLIAEPELNLIGCCNELNAGYAADGYARARGVGACVVTFTVGGLSVLNAIAGAYSENLPVICIVGGPNSNDYGTNRILHHTIGLPDFTQELRCFQTVTCHQAVVSHLEDAHELIDTAISTALKESKPVYISISCNLPAIPHPTFGRDPVPFFIAPKVSNQIGLEAAVEATAAFLNKAVKPNYCRIFVPPGIPLKAQKDEPLRVNVLFKHIQEIVTPNTAIISETGDSWFNCQKLRLPENCGYEFQMQYGSIGWSVGATLGYAQGAKDKRVIACIGDGSFQVTAQDISTMIRCGQNTIIFLINNGGYTIEVEIHDGPYNVIKNWDYTGLVDAIHNGEGKCWTTKVRTEEDLTEAIAKATGEHKDSLCFIEVFVHKDDTSKELLEWGSRVSAANSRPPNPQ